MDWSNSLMVWVNSLSRLVPIFLITIGCVIYLKKSRKLVGIVLLVGNLLTIITSISSVALFTWRREGISAEAYSRYSMELQAASILAGLIFGVGFLIMMLDMERKKNLPAQGEIEGK